MDEAWLILKYEGGFFTKPPPMEVDAEKFANYERGRDGHDGFYAAGFLGDKYYNDLYQQEEVAALNEAIRQELYRQMVDKGNFSFNAMYRPDASPMMQMREHNFPKVGEPYPPTGAKGTFVMRPYRGPDNDKPALPIRAPVIRSKAFPEYLMDMTYFNDEGEYIGP